MRYISICMIVLALLPARAQGEMDVDWDAYAQDTVMPLYVHSIDLGYNSVDHEYRAIIEYPELEPLLSEDIARFRLPAEAGLPEWPEIQVYKGISAKRAQLDVSFIPIIWRDGKYHKIVSFTLKVEEEPSAAKASSKVASQGENRLSQLSSGRWVKLRVSDNGIHMLTHARLRGLGFDDPGKVRLFGYGGHPLSESDTDSWIDDLCEVPLWRIDDRLLFYQKNLIKARSLP